MGRRRESFDRARTPVIRIRPAADARSTHRHGKRRLYIDGGRPRCHPGHPGSTIHHLVPRLRQYGRAGFRRSQPDILKYAWEFGDPASGAANSTDGAEVYHQFSAPGNYLPPNQHQRFWLHQQPNRPNGPGAQYLERPNPPPTHRYFAPGPAFAAPPGGVVYTWPTEYHRREPYGERHGRLRGNPHRRERLYLRPGPGPGKSGRVPAALIKGLLTNDLGQVTETVYASLSICVGDGVRLVAAGTGIYNYKWSSGQTGSSRRLFQRTRQHAARRQAHVRCDRDRSGYRLYRRYRPLRGTGKCVTRAVQHNRFATVRLGRSGHPEDDYARPTRLPVCLDPAIPPRL